MRHPLFPILATILALSSYAIAQVSDGCPEGFAGKDRKKVKNRSVNAGASYPKLNAGSIVYAKDWFGMTCDWDPNLPADYTLKPVKNEYQTKSIAGIENRRVKLRGYLLSVKHDPNDNDFHVEIGDRKAWNSRHLIAEFPSTQASCAARQVLTDLVAADITKYHKPYTGNKHALHRAVCIEVEGYVFVDLHHASSTEAPCESDGGRGLQTTGDSKVVGIYEIHPAFSARVVSDCTP